MDIITSLLAVITGFVLRLAIPIAVTAIAIYFLRRLDDRWQAEGQDQFLQLPFEKVECWEINGCTDEMRKDCPGYLLEVPCWQARRKQNGYLQEQCLGCDIFRKAPVPAQQY